MVEPASRQVGGVVNRVTSRIVDSIAKLVKGNDAVDTQSAPLLAVTV